MNDRCAKYRLVKAGVTDWLRDGRWKFGQAIPSEPMLAHRFGVSVGTVRRAIDELVAENILVRKQGRGTFVTSHTRDYLFNVFFRIVNQEKQKERAVPLLMSFRRIAADRTTARALRIAHGAPVYRIRNRIELEGTAIALDDIRLPEKLFPDLTESALSRRETTVYGVLQERYGISALWAEELVSAVIAGKSVRAVLDLAHPAAVLKVQRTAYTSRDVPIDFRYRFVRTTHHYYQIFLGRH